ncbi:NAD(P)-dependent alcohol dehydrogenase [Marivirga sp. S37H4]|uniref:NAD(P)-dependent alcohol dehydrogenase n=1 Tax=Marivirga aurantiaca TaxID=2802615 RepID=A0A934X2G6_9BACT|nr:NAD(P)-dependent alcohol dehydrogenase [Marivirga aurantiaca]MBK6267165.1 NAD(P)-dependent alcohol dehydrogenase [Marivirga aurantiaca]
MKAIVYTKYGTPGVLHLKELDKPIPKENEVLVKIHTASVNSWDWDLLTGKPYLYRLLFGIFKPKHNILGCDIAGRVEDVGKKVEQLKLGDEVFGDISTYWGGFAEYVCVPENTLALKPASMKFEEAAATPHAAVLALQSLRDKKQLKKGEKVLIIGAGGGVGTFAVQMAKLFGAEVTAVDSAEKLEMLSSLGANHVIDYKQEDFTKNGQCYDLIIDVVASRSVFEYKKSLMANGICVIVGGSISTLLQTAIFGSLISGSQNKKVSVLIHEANKDIAFIKELFEEGKVKPIIDKSYSLEEVPDALACLGNGKARGKLVINVLND